MKKAIITLVWLPALIVVLLNASAVYAEDNDAVLSTSDEGAAAVIAADGTGFDGETVPGTEVSEDSALTEEGSAIYVQAGASDNSSGNDNETKEVPDLAEEASGENEITDVTVTENPSDVNDEYEAVVLTEETDESLSDQEELGADVLDEVLTQKVWQGRKYLLYSNGRHYQGWYNMNEYWTLYYDPQNDGAAVTGPFTIDGITYFFNEDGILVREAGTPVYNGFKYWVDRSGVVHTGWLYLGNWKMYFSPDDFAAAAGFSEIGGKTYLFNDDGVMQNFAGTPIINGNKYWFSTDDASLKTGWLQLGSMKLYFDPKTFAAYLGVHEVNGKMYVFDPNGVVNEICGTPVVNGKKYWTDADGSLRSGWLQLGSLLLYFDPDTYEGVTGTVVIDGESCVFDENGVLQNVSGSGSVLVDIAAEYLGTLYYWGGDTPQTGFDCSGFVNWCYYRAGCGYLASRSSGSMLSLYSGTKYDVTPADITASALLVGDLVVVDYGSGSHAAFYAGDGLLIGSTGGDPSVFGNNPEAKVRYDTLTSYTSAVGGVVQRIKVFRVPVSDW